MTGEWLNVVSGAAILAAVLSIAFGLLNCFFGYRIFKVLLGIYGFGLGAIIGLAVAGSVAKGQALWLIVGGVVGGVVGAALMVLLYFVGVFVVGAVAGALLVNLIGAALGIRLPDLVSLIAAVVVGVIALILQRSVIILATAFSGAWGVAGGAMSLLTGRAAFLVSPLERPQVWQRPGLAGSRLVLLLALLVWLVLGIAGAVVQFRTTVEKPPAKAKR